MFRHSRDDLRVLGSEQATLDAFEQIVHRALDFRQFRFGKSELCAKLLGLFICPVQQVSQQRYKTIAAEDLRADAIEHDFVENVARDGG
ncbi:hypothetical protein WJS89_05670 [Sphingomicrobium sp. XHP0235]|uniref:hypothetical protein n=1 Tax=Sphingomicrobium aquimarinum TaxID=3133971 RepID=UPI0031FEACC6